MKIFLSLIFYSFEEIFVLERAGGCVVKGSARGSEGHRFDTPVHQLSD